MAGINDYSNTPSLNTTINTIDVDEGCNPANINNAIRQLMADIADVDDGVVPLQTPDINGGTIDGATIGGTTPGAGTFTTATATTFSGSGASLTNIPNSALTNSSITINGTATALGGSINVGDITGVTAGNGLTGGGTSGTPTLNVGAGTGVTVAADTVSIGQDVATSATPTFQSVNLSRSTGYGYIEMGGPSGAYIDMKSPASDDYDARLITTGSDLQLLGATGVPIKLGYGTSIKLTTTSTGIDVTGTVLTDKAYIAEATLTDSATISWNMNTQSVCKVTLGGNRTLAAPTNGSTGQFATITVIQDGTGSRTLTWNAVYEFKDDTAPTLTTTGGKGDVFVFKYNGSKWLEVGRNLNLTLS